jgi:hypothetical protein
MCTFIVTNGEKHGEKRCRKKAFAEIILNRTLAYQAAVAVHTLKDLLDLDVQELRLVVEPLREDLPAILRNVHDRIGRIAAAPQRNG